jgi:hypothetical protein
MAHPNDLDLRCVFLEAILNRTPWRMWDLRTGTPAPGAGTTEAREVLETAFRDLAEAFGRNLRSNAGLACDSDHCRTGKFPPRSGKSSALPRQGLQPASRPVT